MPVTRHIAAASRLPRFFGVGVIRLYRLVLSPWVGTQCRHLPTCSAYGEEAITRFGLWAGGWMTLARFCRCHPLGTRGLDFVPVVVPAEARWFLPWRYGRWRGTDPTPPERPASRGDQCDGESAATAPSEAADASSRRAASSRPS